MADRRPKELILLDTHIWIWMVDKNPRLNPSFAKIIRDNDKYLSVSVVSCWEISMLVAKGRLDLGGPPEKWFEYVIAESGILVVPLTPRITAEAYSLPGTFHDDPADRMIVATARSRDCLLLTEDQKILNYSHVRTS
ncbi:MAG TPA: type II toxin-antitoxin system VapC family toxin [Candidatus Kapabacteria bacterium]|jgi:PIN domain nuclease of toxin-antitoxin system|nr:type II toxin-antitoxin system VapC family toxin [Candidatus Kapabacteria bacterium]